MKIRTIVTCLALLSCVAALPGQATKAKPESKSKASSKGWVGKKLPPLRGHEGSDSRWLGKASEVTPKKLHGKVVLVVLTSWA